MGATETRTLHGYFLVKLGTKSRRRTRGGKGNHSLCPLGRSDLHSGVRERRREEGEKEVGSSVAGKINLLATGREKTS